MTMEPGTRYIKPELVRKFVVDLFGQYGLSRRDATMLADNLIDADIRGVTTHGLTRIPSYIGKIEAGLCDPKAQPNVIRSMPATAVIDAKNCMGQVSGTIAMELAIDMAEKYGIGFVGVRNGCHYGTAGYYAMMAERKCMIGVSTTNSGVFVAPYGGIEARLGTNPVAVALPAKKHLPILLDMATSRVARGKILVSMKKGEAIPADWALDINGNVTTNSVDAFNGILLPLSYKGYGMAVVIDMLTGVLMGSGYGNQVDLPAAFPLVGSNFLAIKTEAFCEIDEFTSKVDALIDEIKNVKRDAETECVYMPGEIEFNIERENMEKGGVPVQPFQIKELDLLAQKNGLKIQDYFG